MQRALHLIVRPFNQAHVLVTGDAGSIATIARDVVVSGLIDNCHFSIVGSGPLPCGSQWNLIQQPLDRYVRSTADEYDIVVHESKSLSPWRAVNCITSSPTLYARTGFMVLGLSAQLELTEFNSFIYKNLTLSGYYSNLFSVEQTKTNSILVYLVRRFR